MVAFQIYTDQTQTYFFNIYIKKTLHHSQRSGNLASPKQSNMCDFHTEPQHPRSELMKCKFFRLTWADLYHRQPQMWLFLLGLQMCSEGRIVSKKPRLPRGCGRMSCKYKELWLLMWQETWSMWRCYSKQHPCSETWRSWTEVRAYVGEDIQPLGLELPEVKSSLATAQHAVSVTDWQSSRRVPWAYLCI